MRILSNLFSTYNEPRATTIPPTYGLPKTFYVNFEVILFLFNLSHKPRYSFNILRDKWISRVNQRSLKIQDARKTENVTEILINIAKILQCTLFLAVIFYEVVTEQSPYSGPCLNCYIFFSSNVSLQLI